MKLLYFDFAGRGEAIRDALKIAGVPFEDARVSYFDFQRMKLQGELPFHTLPVLILADGTQISQSNTILRYVAKVGGLTPVATSDAIDVESLLDYAEDLGGRISVSIRVGDEALRAGLRRELAERWIPESLALLEQRLLRHGQAWLVGNTLTVADLKWYHWIEKLSNGSLTGIPTTIAEPYQMLAAWRERVRSHRTGKVSRL